MNRKWIALSAVMTITAAMSLGCSGKNEPAPPAEASGKPEASSSPKAAPVSLKFWGGVPPESGPQQVVDKWNKEHPDIQVEYIRYVNDDTGNLKLETALLSKTETPDLFMTYADERITKRVQAGMTEPLDDLIAKSGFDLNGVIGADRIFKYDNKIHYIPASRSIGAIMINKTALEEAGEKLPVSWTWDEFAALAKKLTKETARAWCWSPPKARSANMWPRPRSLPTG
ncbi:extracellular solute-binding protein [Paenibacillus sp. CC-CFT747]|nr:extracellular solute-binding protein [Paenibacillus sp. CC-CFT747]